MTVGDAIRLDQAELVRAIGATDAERLRRAACSSEGADGASGVAERPLPRRLIAEKSFPPTTSLEGVQVKR